MHEIYENGNNRNFEMISLFATTKIECSESVVNNSTHFAAEIRHISLLIFYEEACSVQTLQLDENWEFLNNKWGKRLFLQKFCHPIMK